MRVRNLVLLSLRASLKRVSSAMVADLDYLEGKADGKAEIIACTEEHLR